MSEKRKLLTVNHRANKFGGVRSSSSYRPHFSSWSMHAFGCDEAETQNRRIAQWFSNFSRCNAFGKFAELATHQ